ncbi:MAG: MerR family transcriptional regulator [Acidobacteria bacterium]|nr:MerR family transcriptional regulator [Acidobacteriota bacterium]
MKRPQFIGPVARDAGVSVHTVRYYERLGLLPPPNRTPAGYRVYEQAAAERLRFIQQAQALGFSLAEIKEIARMKYAGQSPCRCVRRRLRQRLKELEREMKRLHSIRRQIRACLQASRRLPRLPHAASRICPIIESAVKR